MGVACLILLVAGCADQSDPAAGVRGSPPPTMDVVQTMDTPEMAPLGTFLRAIQAAGLVDELSARGPFTVFAPTNDAFVSLPPGMLSDLLRPDQRDKLRVLLLSHVHVGDAVQSREMGTEQLSTAGGRPVVLANRGGVVTVDDAKVIKADVPCTNGVIYWIDKVLVPTGTAPSLSPDR
jgi:uncharacterized surface protein with fasciclin (FAS1) repeats